MKLRSALLASAFGLGMAFTATQASAITVTGSSSGTFANLSSCDTSGFDANCRIVNSNTQVQWGSTSSSGNGFDNPSTLTAVGVNINTATNANDVRIAQLTWFNSATTSDSDLASFGVQWTLSISFTAPNASGDTETFDLTIQNPTNPPGDTTSGFTMADLSGLVFNLNGVTVSDLKYSVEDQGGNDCSGDDTSFSGNTWFNCEENTAKLYITADFTATPAQVPEPATLALLGMGLLGLGAVRRRKAA